MTTAKISQVDPLRAITAGDLIETETAAGVSGRSALGTAAGNNTGDFQPADPDLTALAALGDGLPVRSSGSWSSEVRSEGPWTPAMAFATPGTSSFSYATQAGYYWRWGGVVLISARLNVTPTIGTGSGLIRITGLPVACHASDGFAAIGINNIGVNFTWPSSVTAPVIVPVVGQSYLNIQGLKSASAPVAFQATAMTDGAAHELRFSGWYRVA